MRGLLISVTMSLLILSTVSCDGKDEPLAAPEQTQEQPQKPQEEQKEQEQTQQQTSGSMTITITAGGKTFTADIEDTATGKAFMEKLPLTLDMSELNGNEKYCYGVSLPKADKRYDSISAGDLMLYSGNCVVLFYGSAGGYNYTRIGKLKSAEGLASALGQSSVKVTFSK